MVTKESDVGEAVYLAAADGSGRLRFAAGVDAVALAEAQVATLRQATTYGTSTGWSGGSWTGIGGGSVSGVSGASLVSGSRSGCGGEGA